MGWPKSVWSIGTSGHWWPWRTSPKHETAHAGFDAVVAQLGRVYALVDALEAHPQNAHHVATKATVVSLTKSFVQEYAKDQILVNSVAPVGFATDRAEELDHIVRPDRGTADRSSHRGGDGKGGRGLRRSPEGQSRVYSAETERLADDGAERCGPAFIGHGIKSAVGIFPQPIDGWR